ncbi:hypothetical protein O181_025437 [Austropuccinia psidii MF-1]|uniref:Uncharacterized protein n=1 Tax=Austropuccinia psidii MF-1 TaxID=1389203 RepID=A0A9Q3CL60_9BASI|nr:hypothetical protein [Austropuccinia psidii MF-1]
MRNIIFILSDPYITNNTSSQRSKSALTPTERAPLHHTPSVHQLSENLDTGPPTVGEAPHRRGVPRSIFWEVEDEEGEESVKEEEEEDTKVTGSPEASGAPSLTLSNQPLVSQAKQNFLKMMEQMTKFMGQLTQAVAPRDNYRSSAFKTPSMKEPNTFDTTQAHKFREFIISFQSIFHNGLENVSSYRTKMLY